MFYFLSWVVGAWLSILFLTKLNVYRGNSLSLLMVYLIIQHMHVLNINDSIKLCVVELLRYSIHVV